MKLPPIDLNKDKAKMTALIAILGVLILIAYFSLILGPQMMRLTEILGRTGRMMSDMKSAELLISKKEELKDNIESSRETVERYEKRLPVEQEIPNILENLSSMAKSSNVKIIGITPVPLSAKDQMAQKGKIYKEIPILVSAKSGYHELGSFLSDLENADRFMKVVDIEIKSNKTAPKRHDIELIVCTYVLLNEK